MTWQVMMFKCAWMSLVQVYIQGREWRGRGEGRELGMQATQQSCPQPLPMFSLSLVVHRTTCIVRTWYIISHE